MKLLFATAGFFGVLLTLQSPQAYAQQGETENDTSLNAMQVILSVVNEERRPACTGQPFLQKKLRFCPLVARCPNEKPFCVTRTEKREGSRSVKRSCVCSNTAANQEETIENVTTGKVEGTIVVTNSCGGAQREGDDCKRAYVGRYIIKDVKGKETVSTTNADGHFTVNLAPGRYTLLVRNENSDTEDELVVRNSKVFNVLRGRTVAVRLEIDSGIRFPMPQ